MNRTFCALMLTTAFLLIGPPAVAQVATGTPPWSSIEGGPDVVNLGNLNAHMAYPVRHKAGRQLPLNYDLTSDNSIWYKVTSGSTTSWTPLGGRGWAGSPAGVGNILYQTLSDGFSYIIVGGWVYYDGAGTSHPFAGQAAWYSCAFWTPCGDFTLSTTTADGSGYSLNADACFVINGACNLKANQTSADGNNIIPQNGIPLNPTALAGSVIDRNGNQITTNGSGQITDTLGTVALTSSGGNPNPYVLSYTSPAGTAANVTVTFQAYNVRTNFACSGVSEYGPISQSLVDKITFQDGERPPDF